jgi:hypothetical protein
MRANLGEEVLTVEDRIPRRAVLGVGLAMAVGVTGTRHAAAQPKAAQKLVQYQDKPKGDQECDKCLHWVPPDACKVVEGKINPKGWCALYAPKPK